MKTIGLLGGMSWESTLPYYRIINETVNARLGGFHSAKLVLASVDFHEIERFQRENAWDDAGELLAGAARGLRAAGADFLVLCTNTMHKVAPAIERGGGLPLLHIVDATAERITHERLDTIGLLGTRFTMEQAFYRDKLRDHGLNVLTPPEGDREVVHDVIYRELCHGTVREASRSEYRRIIAALVQRGARGIILGCTEIAMLVNAHDAPVPLFDTTRLHAQKAVDLALAGSAQLEFDSPGGS